MNRTLLVSNHVADIRPVLAGFRLSDRERADLAVLRGKLVELDAELTKVANPVLNAGLKRARCDVRNGTGGPAELQAALRMREDGQAVRRALKDRGALLGAEAGRLLEPIFTRAVSVARPKVERLRVEATERIKRFLPTADADELARQDVVLVAVEAAVGLLETHARSCTDAQGAGGRWRPSAETVDRLLASLGEKISDAAKAST